MLVETKAIPASPTSSKGEQVAGWLPHEVDPELALAKLMQDMTRQMGRPSVISTPFVVRYGILRGLNHRVKGTDGEKDPGNPTGLDCSMLLSVFEKVKEESINVNGMYFEHLWQYSMKPKMVIQGLPQQTAFQEDQKESMWERFAPTWLGGKPAREVKQNGS